MAATIQMSGAQRVGNKGNKVIKVGNWIPARHQPARN